MQKLLNTLVSAIKTTENFNDLQEFLAGVIEVESEPDRIAIGLNSCFVEIQERSIWFVCEGERVEVKDIFHMRSVVNDLEQRLLLPFTGGTDELEDLENSTNGTMPDVIIGGGEGAGGQVQIDDIPGLQDELDNKLPSFIISNNEPITGNIWLEPAAIAPQPWVKENDNWYSEAFPIDFSPPSFSTGILTLSKLIPPRVPRVKIEAGYGQLRTNGSGSNSSNYYTMRVRIWKRDGSSVDIISFNNQNQTLGTSRFENYDSPVSVDNVAYIEFRIERSGTSSSINVTTSATIDIRYGR